MHLQLFLELFCYGVGGIWGSIVGGYFYFVGFFDRVGLILGGVGWMGVIGWGLLLVGFWGWLLLV